MWQNNQTSGDTFGDKLGAKVGGTEPFVNFQDDSISARLGAKASVEVDQPGSGEVPPQASNRGRKP